jgi:hypothetical protein
MDALTGWAGRMIMKQKMGNIADQIPGGTTSKKEEPAKPMEARAIRKDIAKQRAERDAEHEQKKAERAAKKGGGSMAERWANNKGAANK